MPVQEGDVILLRIGDRLEEAKVSSVDMIHGGKITLTARAISPDPDLFSLYRQSPR